uniref:Uncharacterized protein n=1 Tax=Rhizophora mucronata TaxID=61149 RepID=A0A2P2L9U7_RHIMU
MAVRHGIWKRP